MSIRFTQIHTEIATETGFSRFHSLSPVGEQFNGLYPSCIVTPESSGNSRPDLDRDWYNDHVKLIELTNYLQRNNKAFNYEFRNSSCVYPTHCDFPEAHPAYNRNDASILVFGVEGICVILGLLITSIIIIAEKKCGHGQG